MGGTVKSYSASKGYGFIEFAGKDVFVGAKDLQGRCMKQGDKATFKLVQGEKGPTAQNVKVDAADGEAQYKGSIKSFNYQKGFGFISCEAFEDKDIFFMKTELSQQAREGHVQP